MYKYIELFAKAIGLKKSVRRTRHELAKTKGAMAKGWGRPIYSTSKEPPKDEEAPTTESKTSSLVNAQGELDIHEQYHNDPSKHLGCCGFIECRTSSGIHHRKHDRTASKTSHNKDIYILTGKKGS
jgi:hypothetical protein|tara:strand:+ start:955 stop:1332 length:378 start_codon:yes stop_codon:yes gene_type:complete